MVQTLSDPLLPNTTYTLDVEIGNIAAGTSVSNDFFELSGFPGYRVELLAGGEMIAQDNNSLAGTIPDGEFATSTIEFTTGDDHDQLGETLGIRLVNLNQIDPAHPGSDLEVDFDDIRLDATAAILPSNASFNAVADVDLINLDFGTVNAGEVVAPIGFSLTNLVDTGSVVDLDLVSITPSGDIATLSTDLTAFIDLTEGGTLNFESFIDTSVAGSFSASYDLNFTDELGTNQILTLNLLGDVACGEGDADCDGDVDLDDIIIAVGAFTGPCTDGVDCMGDPSNGGSPFTLNRSDGDVNDRGTAVFGVPPLLGDGDVDLDDLILMVGSFTGPLDSEGGFAPPVNNLVANNLGAVPEPSTFFLAALGLLGLGGLCRRRSEGIWS